MVLSTFLRFRWKVVHFSKMQGRERILIRNYVYIIRPCLGDEISSRVFPNKWKVLDELENPEDLAVWMRFWNPKQGRKSSGNGQFLEKKKPSTLFPLWQHVSILPSFSPMSPSACKYPTKDYFDCIPRNVLPWDSYKLPKGKKSVLKSQGKFSLLSKQI